MVCQSECSSWAGSVSAFEAVSIGIVLSYIVKIDALRLYDFHSSTVYGSRVLLALSCTFVVAAINLRGVALATRVH